MLVKRNYQPTFNSLVNELFNNDVNERLDSSYSSKPKANIKETESNFEIDMLVPGFDKSDLEIHIEENLLSVSVEKEEQTEENKDTMLFREFSLKNFKRSFRLSHKVDKENIEANFNNGILSITIPKKEETLIRKAITIK